MLALNVETMSTIPESSMIRTSAVRVCRERPCRQNESFTKYHHACHMGINIGRRGRVVHSLGSSTKTKRCPCSTNHLDLLNTAPARVIPNGLNATWLSLIMLRFNNLPANVKHRHLNR